MVAILSTYTTVESNLTSVACLCGHDSNSIDLATHPVIHQPVSACYNTLLSILDFMLVGEFNVL